MKKRIFDISVALIIALPAIIIISIAVVFIKSEGPGPAIFKQIRVGLDKKYFTLLKLRTMDVNSDDRPSHHASASQITKVGKLLRRTKIDELPQIWSVLVGDMSFVGPRPCLPMQKELIRARTRHNAFSVLPGITGPAQIANIDMSTPELLAEVDGRYVAERSLVRDLIYLWATVFGKGSGDAIG